ncbi:hypothetical protein [Brevundimonas nasdae]|uniref:hypothetical protein n=1 Tax=Brevundimonas nasdae TaxID=172043 RepID=UPI00289A8AE3|nr:hypothetical protein [Brevundimonas nasdae]
MRVATFMSAVDGAIARIEMPMPTKGGKMKLAWSPVVIHAPTEDEARTKAEDFYASELERLASKEQNIAAGRVKAAISRANGADQ